MYVFCVCWQDINKKMSVALNEAIALAIDAQAKVMEERCVMAEFFHQT